MEFVHKSVLLAECIEGLDIKPDGIYVDGTAGGGGHSLEIAKHLTTGRLIAIDKDDEALAACALRLSEYKDKVTLVHEDFKNTLKVLDDLAIGGIDGLLLDLGVSSYQLDNGDRGFSYVKDAPLDMRMDTTAALDAKEVVNGYGEDELIKIFFEYGEERFAKKIAARIVKRRAEAPIETTKQLADIVCECYPKYSNGGHPAKRVFQAIRIEVNGELNGLKEFVESVTLRLKPQGRAAIITFHSLEDRAVKQAFKYLELDCICPPSAPICICNKRQDIEILTRKPITATAEELKINPRAESAKLRIAKRI